ncbi:MAG: indole-3-glycerol phosphate synthase [Nitrospirae bacterium RBG_13_39_12]|nr:MAG: indole-3-glycerol phosphate synthase [Nitrospirae bacterium RBG_13_39_12]
MSILNQIVEKKKERLAYAKQKIPLSELKSKIIDIDRTRDFQKAVKRTDNIKLIAEIKKASPSGGIIRRDFNLSAIAKIYEDKNVSAVSVLTEEDFFQGSLNFLSAVRKVLSKPILRKDFIFDEYQIYESRANEADAILLIAAALDKNQAVEYLHLAKELKLSVLFEIHNFKELEMALLIESDIIGINNRDLKTLVIDLDTTFELKKEIPSGKIIVSESGIKTREDVKKLEDTGIDSVLVGTAFMEADDVGKKIDELMGKV